MAIIKNEELDHEMRKRVEYLQKSNNCIWANISENKKRKKGKRWINEERK